MFGSSVEDGGLGGGCALVFFQALQVAINGLRPLEAS